VIPAVYRRLLRERRTRRFLAGVGASSLGEGMSTVTIAWLAVRIAPAGNLGLFVGLAIAAYTLPGCRKHDLDTGARVTTASTTLADASQQPKLTR
jgi:hypothetical protein